MQVETAKELLNTSDATAIGLLLCFCFLLITANVIQWKKAQEDAKYIRSQDKANLEMLASLSKNAELLGSDIGDIKDKTVDMHPKVAMILEAIQRRLDK